MDQPAPPRPARTGRPDGMSDLEWLVALEEIRQLKARRDRYADAHDWQAYQDLHAPDHVSENVGFPSWTSSEEMIANVSAIMDTMTTVHHSYDAEIVFDTPDSARGIWAMLGGQVAPAEGDPTWRLDFGYYHESYARRDGRWVFTRRRWHRYWGVGSAGATLPDEHPPGSSWPEPVAPSGGRS